MNALVGVRANMSGFLSPNNEARVAVEEKLQSMIRANLLGKMLDGKSVQKIEEVQQGLREDNLSRDAFLELLVSQLQYQDPLEPVDNADMLAQLAQFTSLEQMNNLNESFERLSGNIDQLNFINGGNLLGRTVSGITVDGAAVTGVVERVELEGSIVYLTVDGQRMSMAAVTGISSHEPE